MQRPRFDDEFKDLAALAYRVAYRILGDRSTAEDIAQESLARAYQRWARISEYRQAWVARVAGNLAIDQLRRHRPHLQAPQHGDAEVMMIERLDLQRALLDLPKRQRDAVVLRYIADLSEADVAQLLGCSPGTVKSHLNRGTTRLRLILNDTHGGL
jgi:RNA polymerase sigma-70 factor (sigma-E family)